jgi:hypothetical protein
LGSRRIVSRERNFLESSDLGMDHEFTRVRDALVIQEHGFLCWSLQAVGRNGRMHSRRRPKAYYLGPKISVHLTSRGVNKL